MVEREYTSAEVAQRIGISRGTLNRFVNRNPDIAPAKRLTPKLLMWTEAEIQRLIERRANSKSGGNPPEGQGE